MNLMQLPDELNSKRQDPEDEYKTKMYQSLNLQFTMDFSFSGFLFSFASSFSSLHLLAFWFIFVSRPEGYSSYKREDGTREGS